MLVLLLAAPEGAGPQQQGQRPAASSRVLSTGLLLPINVDAKVSVTLSAPVFNKATKTSEARASIKNTSSTTLSAPMRLVVSKVKPKLVNGEWHQEDGAAFVDVPHAL